MMLLLLCVYVYDLQRSNVTCGVGVREGSVRVPVGGRGPFWKTASRIAFVRGREWWKGRRSFVVRRSRSRANNRSSQPARCVRR